MKKMMDRIKVEQEQKRKKDEARKRPKTNAPPPFPSLSSGIVTSSILSFYGYDDDVKDLM